MLIGVRIFKQIYAYCKTGVEFVKKISWVFISPGHVGRIAEDPLEDFNDIIDVGEATVHIPLIEDLDGSSR